MTDSTHKNDYLVLARKYRPNTFSSMVGQEALVQTLSNALASGRIHHAFVFNGIRGTGKTTTARIMAMALNCENGPSSSWEENDEQVKLIMEGRHPDVLEFDAASHRGVDEIQQLFEGVAYQPVSGRYKVYIIDEVHMLSKQAFNAILKTLEEPPANVKFIFATTEVNKVPITVLSRCQRFDLKRITSGTLADYFMTLLEKEGVEADKDAIHMVARAADGSARDGLSILDQAIALSAGEKITEESVRAMLGGASKERVYDLLENILSGQPEKALEGFAAMYMDGYDALQVVKDLQDSLYTMTRMKLVPTLADSAGLSELEKTRLSPLVAKLSLEGMGRAYQMLHNIFVEASQAGRVHEVVEMGLVRVAHLAPLPAIDKILGRMAGTEAPVVAEAASAEDLPGKSHPKETPPAEEQTPQLPKTPDAWEDIVELVKQAAPVVAGELVHHVRPLMVKDGTLRMQCDEKLAKGEDLVNKVRQILSEKTGKAWEVTLERDAKEAGALTLAEEREEARKERVRQALQDDNVKSLIELYPDSEVVDVVQV
ncbi:MAG: DNA polymerase III subunit gamma/tau [Pseudomonadota bacterium]|nr:DNA polymerase III subunit gamma/tau [Pseudomonadota bacterium]